MHDRAKSRWRFDPNNLTARDVLVIVPLVLGLGACTVAFGLHVSHEVYIKWGGLALNTAVLFGVAAYYYRNFLRTQRFWIQLLSGLVLHLVVWIILLSQVDEWRLAWFLIMIVEAPAFQFIKDLLDRNR